MKRSRSPSHQDAKDTSTTGKMVPGEEDVDVIREHPRPRIPRTGGVDSRGGPPPVPPGGATVGMGLSHELPPNMHGAPPRGRDDTSLMANTLLLRQAQLSQPGWAGAADHGIGGPRVNPNLVPNENRAFPFNSNHLLNHQDPRSSVMTLPNHQRPEGVGGQPSAAGPSADPRVIVGYEANGMPIMVPASVALSLMSMNIPGGAPGAGVVPTPPGVPQPPQNLLYPQLLARAQQQQQRQLAGATTNSNARNAEGGSGGGGGHSSSGSGRSSADNTSSELQANALRSAAGAGNIGIMGAQGFPVGAAARGPPVVPPPPMPGAPLPLLGGADAALFNRGVAEAGGFPFSSGAMIGEGQLPPFPPGVPNHQGNGGGPQPPHPRAKGAQKAYILHMSCDDESLSDYQCLVRKQIEVFESQTEDVESNAQGRNRPLVLKQVGIRCRHCAKLPPRHRTRGSTYYPAKLQGLYQAAQNMASNHLCGYCQTIPETLKQELRTLRDRKSPAGGGKQYWADGVKVLGVYEHEDGLRFSDE